MFPIMSAGTSTGYQVQRSLRLRASASAYLNKTFGTPTNVLKWTYHDVIKRGTIGTTYEVLFAAGTSGSAYAAIWFHNDTLEIFGFGGATTYQLVTTQLFRDPSAHYAIQVAFDSSQAVASDRIKVYINGTQVTSFSTASYPTLNYSGFMGSAIAHYIGQFTPALGSLYFDGLRSETSFIDGQQLTPSSFGQFDITSKQWVVKKYTGSYGNNGFYLNYSDNTSTTTLMVDRSGNSNNWTSNNISLTAGATYDSMIDVPMGGGGGERGNYCTLNPLTTLGGSFADGNLRYNNSGGWRSASGTIAVDSGKWSFQAVLTSAPFIPKASNSMWSAIGIRPATVFSDNGDFSTGTNALVFADNGYYKNFSGAWTNSGVTPVNGDVITVNVDLGANTFEFRLNNSVVVSGTIGMTAGTLVVPVHSNFDASNGVMALNFGQRPFSATPPTGYKALHTDNLSIPAIVAPSKHVAVVTTTTSGAITGVGFQADALILKPRAVSSSNRMYDSVRGAPKVLYPDSTIAETTRATSLVSFDTDGFTLGSDFSGVLAVEIALKGGGSAVTNNVGSVSSQVSANTLAGFSIVGATIAAGNQTIGHGLGVTPSLIIAKAKNAVSNWGVWINGFTKDEYVYLNDTAAKTSAGSAWGAATPTSTVFGIGGGTLFSATNQLECYCFAEIRGFSRIISYTGNGSTDGPFVHLGFRPKLVLLKRLDSTGSWYMIDATRNTNNVATTYSLLNSPNAEASDLLWDFVANGLKQRASYAEINASGGSYICIAFAETPFKYALAR